MDIDVADVRPSVLSFATVTIMAIIGIALAKFLMAKWPVPGIAQVVAMA